MLPRPRQFDQQLLSNDDPMWYPLRGFNIALWREQLVREHKCQVVPGSPNDLIRSENEEMTNAVGV